MGGRAHGSSRACHTCIHTAPSGRGSGAWRGQPHGSFSGWGHRTKGVSRAETPTRLGDSSDVRCQGTGFTWKQHVGLDLRPVGCEEGARPPSPLGQPCVAPPPILSLE